MPGLLEVTDGICSVCRRHPPSFDIARAWGIYQGPLRRLIHWFKFRQQPRLAIPLTDLLEKALQDLEMDGPRWIVEVPSHPARIKERGLDHSRLLARKLSQKTGIPLFQGLRRVRQTKPQLGLQREERRRNLRGAFRLEGGEVLEGSPLIVVDDVLTTGTTANEVARVLKKEASPVAVGVVCIARTCLLYVD